MLQKCFANVEKMDFCSRRRMKCHLRLAEVRVQTFLNAAEHDVEIYLLCKYSRDEVRRTVWLEREACCCPWRFLSFSTADSSLRWALRPFRAKRVVLFFCSPPFDLTRAEQRGCWLLQTMSSAFFLDILLSGLDKRSAAIIGRNGVTHSYSALQHFSDKASPESFHFKR